MSLINILKILLLLTRERPQAVSLIILSISVVILIEVPHVSRKLRTCIGKHGGLWTLISIRARMGPRSNVGWQKRTTGWNNASNLGPSDSSRHLSPHGVNSVMLN